MWPTIAEFHTPSGSLDVHTFGVLLVLAFSAGLLAVHLRAPKAGIHPDWLLPGYVSATVGGLIDGLIGAAIGVGVFVAVAKLPPWKIADLAMPAVLLGLGLVHLGCFFAGCCHGAEAPVGAASIGLLSDAFPGGQVWLSPVLPFLTNEVHGGAGHLLHQPLYPVQLWEFVANAALALFLLWHWPRRTFDGQSAVLALMTEPLFRFLIEFFRADLGHHTIGLATSQGVGLVMMAVGAVIWVVRRNERIPVSTIDSDDANLLEGLT